jgi:K+-transporting ATPase ATPase C chain
MLRFLPTLGIAVRITVVLMVLTGLIYPLALTGVAQVIFPHRANGSLITHNGEVIGSSLIGQQFTSPRYFHGRPSATLDANGTPQPYNAANSGAANLGPTNPDLIAAVEAAAADVRCENGLPPGPTSVVPPAEPTPTGCAPVSQPNATQVPVDAVTSSGSGLDPDISVAYALLQVPRVAQARGLSEETVRRLVEQHTLGRQFGFLGEERVNVLDLNLALDRLSQEQ